MRGHHERSPAPVTFRLSFPAPALFLFRLFQVDVMCVGTTGMPLLQLAVRSQRLDLVRTLLDWGEAHGEHCNAAYAFLRFFGPVVCLLAPCWTGARRTVSWACNTVWRYMLLPSFVPKASGYGHGAC